jgi:Uma2 family endonuclease
MLTKTSRPRTHPTNILRGVSWKSYIRMRNHPGNDHLRMSYLDGTLILMSPEYIHERDSGRLALLVRFVAEALAIDVAGIGTTTLRKKGRGRRKGSGKEADNGFYVGANEARIRRKTTIDLEVDAPPDLAIEVDNKSDSAVALPTYARIRVPEVWRYDARENTLWFGRLAGETYVAIDRSLCLPMLTPGLVIQALDVFENGDMSETAWLSWLREWARALPEPPKP